MKKILFLLGIYMSMGFTARENKAGDSPSSPVLKKIVPSAGYIETTSPDTYAIILQ